MLGPNLFNETEPIEIMVWLESTNAGATDDTRRVTLRLKALGRPSIIASGVVDRYAPERQVLMALSSLLGEFESHESLPRKPQLQAMLRSALAMWVDPF